MASATPAGAILGELLARLEYRERLRDYRVFNVWREVVGDVLADHAEPLSIEGGKLFIRAATSTWMQEVQCLKDEIRRKLNRHLGAPIVRDLFLILGPVRGKAEAPEEPPPHPVDESAVAELVPSIGRPEIEAMVRRVARARARRLGPSG